jgi:hypothetical protein
MRNKKTIKEFRAFYIMASSVYAKSSCRVANRYGRQYIGD